MHAVASQIRERLAGAVVQHDRGRRRRERAVDRVPGEAHAVPGGIERQAGVEEPRPQPRALNVDPDFGEQPACLVDDAVAQPVIEHAEVGTHGEILL